MSHDVDSPKLARFSINEVRIFNEFCFALHIEEHLIAIPEADSAGRMPAHLYIEIQEESIQWSLVHNLR